MNAEIICVGTELLLGDILNTNSQYLSRRLAELGINVFSQSVVGDNSERLKLQLKQSLGRSDIIVLSGGLGPTEDDITKETVAEVLGQKFELHTKSLELIEEYFARTGKVMSENNKKQALTIKGAKVLENGFGTAPGYIVQKGEKLIILLPGPPSELVPMFEESVLPFLSSLGNGIIYSENIRIFGIGESLVATQCGDLLKSENPTACTLAKAGEVLIRVTAKAENEGLAKELIKPFVQKLIAQFGTNIYTVKDETLQQRVVELLREKGKKIATAESCTAGMLSSRLTEVSGSSDIFDMGISAYANHVKVQTLGVSDKVISEKGAVSKEVAAQMSVGIRSLSGADIGVGITGVAGPGESEGKPAGLVYIAICDGINVYVRKIMCRGSDRENTRTVATSTALDMVRRYLENAEDLLSHGTFLGDPIDLMEGYSLPNNKPISLKGEVPQEFKELQKKLSFEDDEMLRLVDLMKNDELEALGVERKSTVGFDFENDNDFESDTKSESKEPFATGEADFKIFKEDIPAFRKNIKKRVKRINIKPSKNKNLKEKNTAADKNDTSKKGIKGFFMGIVPLKKDSTPEKLRKSAFLASFLVLIISVSVILNYFTVSTKQQKIYGDLSAVYHTTNTVKGDEKSEDGYFIAFEELKKANSDIKGWLTIGDTKIDYPVYQTDNNDFYINHDMNKKLSRYGALFVDCDSQIGSLRNSRNTVIYGHSMRDGSMFGELKKYLNFEFYKAHPTFDFSTIYNKNSYKVFAVFVTNSLPQHDAGEVFDYRKSAFSSENEFNVWVSEVRKRSNVITDIDINFDDELLTLSTCAYDFDDARLVVMARKVRDDEDYSKAITAIVNAAPLYPEIWYTERGQSKPSYVVESKIPSTQSNVTSNQSSLTSNQSNLSSTEGAPLVSNDNSATEPVPTDPNMDSSSSATQSGMYDSGGGATFFGLEDAMNMD